MLENIYNDDLYSEENYLLDKTLLKLYDVGKSLEIVLFYIHEYKRSKAKCVNSSLVDNLKIILIKYQVLGLMLMQNLLIALKYYIRC